MRVCLCACVCMYSTSTRQIVNLGGLTGSPRRGAEGPKDRRQNEVKG